MPSTREMLYDEAEGVCCYCGRLTYLIPRSDQPLDLLATKEHIVPVSQGGTNDWANLALACQGCNGGRGDGPAQPAPYLPEVRTPPSPEYMRTPSRKAGSPTRMSDWQPAAPMPTYAAAALRMRAPSHDAILREALARYGAHLPGNAPRLETIRMLRLTYLMDADMTAPARRPWPIIACVDCTIPLTAPYGVPAGLTGLRCYQCAVRLARRRRPVAFPPRKLRCAQCGNPLTVHRLPAPQRPAGIVTPYCSAACYREASLDFRPATPAGRATVTAPREDCTRSAL